MTFCKKSWPGRRAAPSASIRRQRTLNPKHRRAGGSYAALVVRDQRPRPTPNAASAKIHSFQSV